jgi:MFS transporter, DHA1 family, inner membrane transport protein
MLSALALGSFLVSASAISISPFLLQMAADLRTDLAAVGNLVAFQSVTWGVASLLAGTASDRLGRRPLLVTGLSVMMLSGFGVALAADYPTIVAWRLIGGLGGGAYMGTVYAAASDNVPVAERGRAMGWVITGQSLSLLLGVPVMTLLGAWAGWRGAVGIHAATMLLATAAVWSLVPRVARPTARKSSAESPPVLALLNFRAAALLGAGTTERVCYAAVVVFFPTFLLTAYNPSFPQLAVALAVVALGNLAGNLVGSIVSDRVRSRIRSSAIALLATGGLALPALVLQPGFLPSVGLGFLYTFADALVRPSLFAAMTELSSRSRGAIMGLNITFSSFGWLGATAVGGWLITSFGFGGLGSFAAAAGLTGAALALGSLVSAARVEPAPAPLAAPHLDTRRD